MALANDGSVYAWGLGTSGQLGQGNKNNSWLAVQVLDPEGENIWHDVVDIDCGYDFSLIITKDKFTEIQTQKIQIRSDQLQILFF